MSTTNKESVLVVGATGNIGVSVIIAALRQKKNVLAVVRNKDSANKIWDNIEIGEKFDRDHITLVEADVTSDGEAGIKGVVEKVKKGELPAFQHVYSTIGMWHPVTPIHDLSLEDYHKVMTVNTYGNFLAYKFTIPYLLSLANSSSPSKPNTTFTLITGAAGTFGSGGVTAVSQGALFSLSAVAARELKDTNVRFNEVYLAYRVDYDSTIDRLKKEEKEGGKGDGMGSADSRMRASEFAKVYEAVLEGDVRGSRVNVFGKGDLGAGNVERR